MTAPAETPTTHIVLLLHGIRTLGEWQDVFEETANRHYGERVPFEIVKLDYGVYSEWKLLFPFWWRPRAVRKFISDWHATVSRHGHPRHAWPLHDREAAAETQAPRS
jgi:hypothetical protein